MADDYLGKKMEEYRSRPAGVMRRPAASLGRLLVKINGFTAFDPQFRVREDQLWRIIDVNSGVRFIRQPLVLRFRPVTGDESAEVLKYIRMDAASAGLFSDVRPQAFIVVSSTADEEREVDIDLGISAQSMILQAAEIGLHGLCIWSFDRCGLRKALALESEPLLIFAVGRGCDKHRQAATALSVAR